MAGEHSHKATSWVVVALIVVASSRPRLRLRHAVPAAGDRRRGHRHHRPGHGRGDRPHGRRLLALRDRAGLRPRPPCAPTPAPGRSAPAAAPRSPARSAARRTRVRSSAWMTPCGLPVRWCIAPTSPLSSLRSACSTSNADASRGAAGTTGARRGRGPELGRLPRGEQRAHLVGQQQARQAEEVLLLGRARARRRCRTRRRRR